MTPLSIITLGCILGGIFLLISFLAPKVKEYNEQVKQEQIAIDNLARQNGWKLQKFESGDIKWTILGPNWQLSYNSDFSSDSSTPFLIWLAATPKSSRARFAMLTESGFKMMNLPFVRRAADKLATSAKQLLTSPQKKSHLSPEHLPPANYNEIFQILDAKSNAPFGKTSTQKLIIAADSAATLQTLRSSQLESLAHQLFSHEKSYVHENNERIARFSTRQEIKIFTSRPTAEIIQKIIKLGDLLLNIKT